MNAKAKNTVLAKGRILVKKLITIAVIGILVLMAGGFTAGTMYLDNHELTINQSPVEFTIEKGASAYGVGEKLEAEGIIGSAAVFKFYVYQHEELANFQAGTYQINTEEIVASLMDRFHKGDTMVDETIQVTFPEGLTTKEIFSLIEEKFGIPADTVLEYAFSVQPEYWFLAEIPKDSTFLDGMLFPDTYTFSPDAGVKEITDKMLNQTAKKLEPFKGKIQSDDRSVREMLTMASLIEKEALHADDRPLIAGVIQNRLDIDMLLQIDATVLAAVGHKETVTYDDLKVDSPYNTYKYKGLPPSPIAMPGIVSIEAALSPAEHDYIFYVADRETGYHHFAVTFAEHEENIQNYWKQK